MLTQRILVTLQEQGALPLIPISSLPFSWTRQTRADGGSREWTPGVLVVCVCVCARIRGVEEGLYLLFMYF